MTLAKRVIPCLDLHEGRVVKSVRFVDTRDAGDPVELALRYDEQGADEMLLPRHHRNARGTRDDVQRPAERGRAGVHPAHDRRRRPHGGRRPPAVARRRRQGVDEHRRRAQPGPRPRGIGRVRRPVRRRRDRRAARRRRLGGRARGRTRCEGRGADPQRDRRDQVGGGGREAGGRRDPAHVVRPRRDEGRLRHRAHARGVRRRRHPRHRVRWRRVAAASRRRREGRPRGRRAHRVDRPLRRVHGRRPQGRDGATRDTGEDRT